MTTWRGGALGATIFAIIGIAILVGLGIWQFERRVWKDELIATTTARLAAPPTGLPAAQEWARLEEGNDEFRRVAFSAEFAAGRDALVYTAGSPLRPDVSGAGYWIFTPARLARGATVVVNRGFVPLEQKAAAPPSGVVEIIGALRWPEARGLFTPADDPRTSTWFVRDPPAMAAAKNWGAVAPFYVDQEAPQSPGGLPRVAPLVVRLPNNHLQYAVTWLGLALVLAAVYAVWLTGRLRRR